MQYFLDKSNYLWFLNHYKMIKVSYVDEVVGLYEGVYVDVIIDGKLHKVYRDKIYDNDDVKVYNGTACMLSDTKPHLYPIKMEVLGNHVILSYIEGKVFGRRENTNINYYIFDDLHCQIDDYTDNDYNVFNIRLELKYDGVVTQMFDCEELDAKYIKNPIVKPALIYPNLTNHIIETDGYYVDGGEVDIGDFDLHGKQLKSARNI